MGKLHLRLRSSRPKTFRKVCPNLFLTRFNRALIRSTTRSLRFLQSSALKTQRASFNQSALTSSAPTFSAHAQIEPCVCITSTLVQFRNKKKTTQKCLRNLTRSYSWKMRLKTWLMAVSGKTQPLLNSTRTSWSLIKTQSTMITLSPEASGQTMVLRVLYTTAETPWRLEQLFRVLPANVRNCLCQAWVKQEPMSLNSLIWLRTVGATSVYREWNSQ